jgi:hypothetical protein
MTLCKWVDIPILNELILPIFMINELKWIVCNESTKCDINYVKILSRLSNESLTNESIVTVFDSSYLNKHCTISKQELFLQRYLVSVYYKL